MRRFCGRLGRRALGAVLAIVGLSQCTAPPPTLEIIRDRGEIRVGTLNQPTTYYFGAQGPEGLEYELARDFAKSLGVNLVMTVYPDEVALRHALRHGDADMVAAHITYRGPWQDFAASSLPYAHVGQLVVFRQGTRRPRTLTDLSGRRIVVSAESPQRDELRTLAANARKPLHWRELPRDSDGGPLDELVARRSDVSIVDGTAYAFDRLAYPEVSPAFELPVKRPIQWIVRKRSVALRGKINEFLQSPATTTRLAKLDADRKQPERRMHFETARTFRSHIEKRLPRFQPFFEEAGNGTGLDWRLLAAVGYQESQWNEAAVSPNGAQGIMMLMSQTAESVGVKDPHDPRDNILGGARYLVEVRDKIPRRIAEPDRMWFALAAYNVGYGHLEDARVITQTRGGDPDRWSDVKNSLPLLAQEAWYSQVKRGYARGWEPVQFVERVQQFLNVLEWRTVTPIETVFQIESDDVAVLPLASTVEPGNT